MDAQPPPGTPPPATPPPGAPPPGTPPPGTPPPATPPLAASTAVPYPVNVQITPQAEYNRLLPLVKWLLLIPHWLVLGFVAIGAFIALILAWFAVLFTRRYPEGLFNFLVGFQRWALRVSAYGLLMTDKYPPFSLQDDPSYPVRLSIEYPEHGVDRWRPLFAWILAYPINLVAQVVLFVAYIASILTFFSILFTKQFPEGIFNLTRGALQLQTRASAYADWMVTVYPPFDFG
ncbi:MAG: DUF4389 domain-containing protein [Actinobacteria bacterium]|nr:MAG: DUF4389 domain-containing protein [Actinomycetota bacterium]